MTVTSKIMPSRDISQETLRAQARLIGLDIEGAELDSLVERTRAALDDIDALDEFDLSGHEPAITFGQPTGKGESQ